MNKKNKGSFLIILGILCIIGSAAFMLFNLYVQKQAANASEMIMREISTAVPPEQTLSEPESAPDPMPTEELPIYVQNPNMEMPVKTIKNNDYIGVLSIPALELELPIISEWNYERLNTSPCRYTGSVYLDNMVICAHNYKGHFGRIDSLKYGDEVRFTDMDGNEFRYAVADIVTLSGAAVDEMTSGDYALTLFTCTVGGRTRVTVRCDRTE